MKKFVTAAGLLFALSAQAGNLQITATGTVSVAPEYVVVTARINSRCYAKSKEAADAAAKLAKEIEVLLKANEATDLKDAYTQVGGAFYRQREAETIYNTSTGKNETIEYCSTGWRTGKTLTLKLKDISKLPDLQDSVLNIVDRTQGLDKAQGPQTWASWENPYPAICDETRAKLEGEALKAALSKARSELAVLAQACQMRDVQLTSVTSGQARGDFQDYGRSANLAATDAPGGMGPSGSSFTFGAIPVSVTRTFTFDFDPAIESCELQKP